jgi:CheY-like chemotaxis protein
LGAKLELESEVEKGSNFYFMLPLSIKDDTPTFQPIEDKTIRITVLMSAKNSSAMLNIARYLVRMNINKNNIVAVSSIKEIPKDTSHLIVFQNQLDAELQVVLSKQMKVLIVEEQLFSMNSEDLQDNCEIISQYGYPAGELYVFINTKTLPRVLIVDDDKTSILLLEKILENEYCEVDIARNGKVALEMIIDSHKKGLAYSVVYIDNSMPLMSGIEVMQRVREFEQDNNLTPIYAVSTSGDMLNLQGNGKDFDKYVGKPFKPAEIRAILYR